MENNNSFLSGLDGSRKLKAKDEIGELEDSVPAQLNTLKKLLKAEKNLKCPLTEDFLMRFLRSRKFNVDRSLSLVKAYFKMKLSHPEVFVDLLPSVLKPIYDLHIQMVLRGVDQHGRKVLLLRPSCWVAHEVQLMDLYRGNLLLCEQFSTSVETQINGIVIIHDLRGFSFSHAKQFTPSALKRVADLVQDRFPARFKELHFIFHPSVFNFVFTILKPFVKPKMRDRLHLHGHDVTSLHKFINRDMLPESLGGNLAYEEALDDEFMEALYSREEYFKELRKYGYKKNS